LALSDMAVNILPGDITGVLRTIIALEEKVSIMINKFLDSIE